MFVPVAPQVFMTTKYKPSKITAFQKFNKATEVFKTSVFALCRIQAAILLFVSITAGKNENVDLGPSRPKVFTEFILENIY